MIHRYDLETVERSLRDCLRNERVFGGICTVLAGDFRQLLAVVPGGTAANAVQASPSSSPLWAQFKVHRLRHNMRLRGADSANQQYAEFLMKVSRESTN